MNKTQLAEAIAAETGLTRSMSLKAVDAVFEAIADSLVQGEKVVLVGFGAFEVRQRKGRVGRNPQTGEPVEVPARRVPAFSAGKLLKERVG